MPLDYSTERPLCRWCDQIAAAQHADEAVDIVMRAGPVNLHRVWKIVNALLDAHFMTRDGKALKEESRHDED